MTPRSHRTPSAPAGHARRARAALGAVLAASSGCSLFVDGFIDQCHDDADCDRKGGAFVGTACVAGACRQTPAPSGNDWSCVGKHPAPVTPKPEIKAALRFTDLTAGTPLAGVSVKPCPRFGPPSCDMPLGPTQTSDTEGLAVVPLSTTETTPGLTGFSGFLLIEGEGHDSVLLSYYPPLLEDIEGRVVLGESRSFEGAARAVDITPDPMRSNAVLIGLDCRGKPSAGMTFRLEDNDPSEKIFYTIGGVPNTAAKATDAIGSAFGVNLRPGYLALTLTSDEVGQVARFSAVVEAGYISIIQAGPDH